MNSSRTEFMPFAFQRTAATGADLLAATTAVLFALLVNQGIFYYILRFSVGSSYQNPWPVLIAVLASTLLSLLVMKVHRHLLQAILLMAGLGVLFGTTALWSPVVAYEKILLGITMPSLCVAAGFVVSRGGKLPLFFTACAVLACLTAIVYTLRGHSPALFSPDRGRYSLIITYQHFSAVMALATIWALQSLGRGLGRNLLAALLGCVFVYFILVSGGRTGLLIVLCGAFAVMYSKVENPFVSLSVFAVLAVLALSGFVLLYVYAYEIARDPEMPATIRRLVHHVFIAREGSSVSTRDVNYAMAYRLFLGAPALGIGWGNFSTAVSILGLTSPYPHNLFLELLAETGLAGTTAFVVVFAYLLLKFFRSGDETEEKSWIVVLFIAGFTISMVSGEYTSQRLLFFSLGAMADYLAKLHERSA